MKQEKTTQKLKVKKKKRTKYPKLEVLSLDKAAKRLNDDEVYRKVSKGIRWDNE